MAGCAARLCVVSTCAVFKGRGSNTAMHVQTGGSEGRCGGKCSSVAQGRVGLTSLRIESLIFTIMCCDSSHQHPAPSQRTAACLTLP